MKINKLFLLAFSAVLLTAGCQDIESPGIIKGNIILNQSSSKSANKPVFIAIAATDNIDLVMSNPGRYINLIVEHDTSSNSFEIDLTDSGIEKDDNIFLFAFSDNDYNGGIPNLTPGDVMGFFINKTTLQTTYTVGEKMEVEININRTVYGHDTEVVGILEGGYSGTVILIAYAGNFTSADFTQIDVNSIIGYKKLTKSNAPQVFNLPILPYGFNTPVNGVYIITLLDKNNNGTPDNGDIIGFASEDPNQNFPEPVTINEGVTSCGTARFKIPVEDENANGNGGDDPENPPFVLNGSFTAPEGYNADSKPVHIVIAKGDDPNQVFDDVENLRLENFVFKTLPAGETSFSIDLPSSKFSAEDNIFIVALWDRDFEGGMPKATNGDKIGFLHHKGNFSYTVKLTGTERINNILDSDSDNVYDYNGEPGYSFNVDRNFYNHASSIRFKMSKGDLSNSDLQDGTNIITVAFYDNDPALQEENSEVQDTWNNYKINYDNIIGTSTITIDGTLNEDYFYNIDILPLIHGDVPVQYNPDFSLNNVWIFAIIDENNNGRPDPGEKIGFYYKIITVFLVVKEEAPDCVQIFNSANGLQKPVRFSNNTYSD